VHIIAASKSPVDFGSFNVRREYIIQPAVAIGLESQFGVAPGVVRQDLPISSEEFDYLAGRLLSAQDLWAEGFATVPAVPTIP
jgi:hypothetical protein